MNPSIGTARKYCMYVPIGTYVRNYLWVGAYVKNVGRQNEAYVRNIGTCTYGKDRARAIRPVGPNLTFGPILPTVRTGPNGPGPYLTYGYLPTVRTGPNGPGPYLTC